MRNIFIIGSKGIPANYGGYETFVEKLTEYHKDNKEIKYHVSCKGTDEKEFTHNNARCFNVKVPNIGPAQAIYYDVMALFKCCDYIKANNIKDPLVYICATRLGLFAKYFYKKIKKLGGTVYVNPDGHEWLRAKWAAPIKAYWRFSERIHARYNDLIVCDSMNIEKYFKEKYKKYNPKTTFIAYGAEMRKSGLADNDEKLVSWYKEKNLTSKGYYLVVGRFVPENNYETMIKEFMLSNSKHDFALITNAGEKFMEELKQRTGFDKDPRIKFVGTVYDQELLMKIRENCYAYLHGHEVGGTNPSLLEALSSTDLNLLLNVGFNSEVAEDGAMYWTKDNGNLAKLIDKADALSSDEIEKFGMLSSKRISDAYNWKLVGDRYMELY